MLIEDAILSRNVLGTNPFNTGGKILLAVGRVVLQEGCAASPVKKIIAEARRSFYRSRGGLSTSAK